MKRIEFIDLLKSFAIFCVLWGHAIQYLRNEYVFYLDPVFEFIYSFHMPLFFIISGFFFSSSLKLNIKDFLLKKGKRLLLPCFIWAILFAICRIFIAKIYGNNFEWATEIKNILIPLNWKFWFLRELFISTLITYISLKLFKKIWLACILSISFVLIAPFLDSLEYQRFLLPIFWAGIYLKNKYIFFEKYSIQTLIISTITFGICLIFWKGNYTIYMTPFPKLLYFRNFSFNFTNMDISIFRLLIGVSGSLFWFFLFKKIYRKNYFITQMEKIGTYTLGIYILQTVFLETWISQIIDFSATNIQVYEFIITPVISLIVLFICIGVIKLIRKNKYTKLLLIGE